MKTIQQHCIKGDCLAWDTLITLGSCEQKCAGDIQCGDRVRTRNGCSIVCNIIQGTEEDILKITTEQASISLTATHPLLTPNGRVKAGEVKVGDTLLTDNGSDIVVSVVVETYNEHVFSFMLGDGEGEEIFLLANGFWAGDYNVQESMPRDHSLEECEMIKEMTRLIDELKKET